MPHYPMVTPTPELRDAIVEVYRPADFGMTSKADDSPLTLADLRSHQIIVASPEALTPGVPILSEESSAASFELRSPWPCHWLVDPLNGTKEFLAKNGEFTVNIALIARHEPMFGVVGVPARDTIYTGLAGLGASRSTVDRAISGTAVTAQPSPDRAPGPRIEGPEFGPSDRPPPIVAPGNVSDHPDRPA